MLKAKALRPGANLGIVSPASAPKRDRVRLGLDALEKLGYRTTLMPHALDSGPLYYAGRIEDRLADLHAAFADDTIDAVFCTRGGWGSAELLPFLDIPLIKANPKPFLGYSDQTSLHTFMLGAAGLVTFYAPMVAADFARNGGAELRSFAHALAGTSLWELTKADGLRMLRPGKATGQLRGGCLSIYTEALGTPYAAPIDGEPTLLFLEDVGVKPYQWDRFLCHLRHAGHLDRAQGIVFGDMSQNVSIEEYGLLEQAILHALRDFPGPIAIGLRCGHVVAPNITLPLGVRAELDLTVHGEPRLTLLESAVSL